MLSLYAVYSSHNILEVLCYVCWKGGQAFMLKNACFGRVLRNHNIPHIMATSYWIHLKLLVSISNIYYYYLKYLQDTTIKCCPENVEKPHFRQSR